MSLSFTYFTLLLLLHLLLILRLLLLFLPLPIHPPLPPPPPTPSPPTSSSTNASSSFSSFLLLPLSSYLLLPFLLPPSPSSFPSPPQLLLYYGLSFFHFRLFFPSVFPPFFCPTSAVRAGELPGSSSRLGSGPEGNMSYRTEGGISVRPRPSVQASD